MKFGDILRLEPLEAGPAGHISRLRIVGSKRTYIIGKELMIRKTLSTSHLLSSAFTVTLEDIQDNVPQTIILNGKGWGHGVGMCQIGAAVMGHQGYSYKDILNHYYPGTYLIES
jgi:SpoIID/LytB domain protein